MDVYSVAIIILFFVAVGMVIGLIFLPKVKFHGPNAIEESKKIYLNKKNMKCVRFGIKPLPCTYQTKIASILKKLKR